jgi:MoaA/NifB/PqqE/SkfB family radical SAM enzyme
VISADHLRSNLLVKLGEVTGRTHVLPLVLFAPTSRCNSRCVSCDWWRSDGASDLTMGEIRKLAHELGRYGTRGVVFTGGEPLLRPDVMEIADVFIERGFKLHLLTSGLALERYASAIATRFGEVTVSLDGHTPELYREIRGVAALDVVLAGVRRIRELAPHIPLRARSTIHRLNFRFLGPLIVKALDAGFDQISFLAADVTSEAFNRIQKLRVLDAAAGGDEPRALILTAEETDEMETVVEDVITTYARELDDRRVVPGPEGLRRLVGYYRAQLGRGPFPTVDCNAPWTSVVIEANGAVRPCFFHAPVGNLRERPLDDLLTQAMPAFRRGLNVATDTTCQRCVCTLKVGLRSKVW